MSSIVFCSKCGKSHNELLTRTVNTMCKDCWLADNNKDKK